MDKHVVVRSVMTRTESQQEDLFFSDQDVIVVFLRPGLIDSILAVSGKRWTWLRGPVTRHIWEITLLIVVSSETVLKTLN